MNDAAGLDLAGFGQIGTRTPPYVVAPPMSRIGMPQQKPHNIF